MILSNLIVNIYYNPITNCGRFSLFKTERNYQNMKKRITALVLSVLMIVSLLPFAVFAADGDDSDGWYPADLVLPAGYLRMGLFLQLPERDV